MITKTNEYIVYSGRFFTIEWYFDSRSKSAAFEYFESLSKERKQKALQLFELMADTGKIKNITKFRHEGGPNLCI